MVKESEQWLLFAEGKDWDGACMKLVGPGNVA